MVHCWVACYTIHCDITHANFQNDQAEKTQITRDSQQKNQYTNKQNDHHTFIHSRSHTQTLTRNISVHSVTSLPIVLTYTHI